MKKSILLITSALLSLSCGFAQSDVGVLLTDNEAEFGAEFIEALRFSYDNGLTKFKTVDAFKPYDELTREQAAKILGVFASDVMEYPKNSPRNCVFNDLEEADPSLQSHIHDACKLGIFKGTQAGDFFPTNSLSKAEAIAVIIRMFNKGALDETGDPWYSEYYAEAKKLELTKEKNMTALERPLTRYEMILLLYRFYVKYSLLEKLNSDTAAFENEDNITLRSVGNGVLVINSSQFLDKNVDEIYAQIDGVTYRLEKSNLISQFDDAYTWYGDVYSLDSEEDDGDYIGVSTFNIIHELVTDGNIRPVILHDWYYQIDISDIRPFYQISKQGEGIDVSTDEDSSLTITLAASQNTTSNTVIEENEDNDIVEEEDDVVVYDTCSGLTIQGQCEELSSCKRSNGSCMRSTN